MWTNSSKLKIVNVRNRDIGRGGHEQRAFSKSITDLWHLWYGTVGDSARIPFLAYPNLRVSIEF